MLFLKKTSIQNMNKIQFQTATTYPVKLSLQNSNCASCGKNVGKTSFVLHLFKTYYSQKEANFSFYCQDMKKPQN